MKIRNSIALLLLVILLSANTTQLEKEVPELGPKCLEKCVTPFGELLGSAGIGLEAYSNCRASCVVWRPNKVKIKEEAEPVYTGVKWQCVEYARRWLLINKGVVYGSVDYAYQIWDQIKFYESPNKKKKICTKNYPNGSKVAPIVGDLLIYAKEFADTGHVAVVSQVDKELKWIRVAEENNLNQKWPGNYAREIKLTKKGNGYHVDDRYLIGWKRALAECPE